VSTFALSALLHLAALAAVLAWADEVPPRVPSAPIPIRWVVVAEAAVSAAPRTAPAPEPARPSAPRRAAARVRPVPIPTRLEARAARALAPEEPAANGPAALPDSAPAPDADVAAAAPVASGTEPGVVPTIPIPRGGYQVKPHFPRAARLRGAEGIALLHARIAPDGEVAELRVERSSGHADLDLAALRAVRRWRFEPLEGAVGAEGAWVQIPVEFRLER
jgi:protein TonB